jgi:hypothetical protein
MYVCYRSLSLLLDARNAREYELLSGCHVWMDYTWNRPFCLYWSEEVVMIPYSNDNPLIGSPVFCSSSWGFES